MNYIQSSHHTPTHSLGYSHMGSWLFLETDQQTSIPGPLRLMCPPPGTLFSKASIWLTYSLPSDISGYI